jgi:hypothetical protein
VKVPGFKVVRFVGDVVGSCLRVIVPPGQIDPELEELSERAAKEDRRHAISDMIEAALGKHANGESHDLFSFY